MSVFSSFKAKLVIGGIAMSAIPLLIVMGMTMQTQKSTTEVAAAECAKLGYETLDHIALGVYNSCVAQAHYHHVEGELDPQKLGSPELRQAIMDIKIADSGYVYVLDSSGHYVVSAGGKRDGADIWNAKDADGVLFIQELIAKARKAPRGTTVEQRYPWQNKGDDVSRMKVVRATYFEEWDWIIGAGSYMDEFMTAETRIHDAGIRNVQVMAAVIFTSLFLVALVAWWNGKKTTEPLLKAVEMANAVAVGDLSSRLNLKLKDEIGDLARALDSMSDGLQEKAELLERVAAGDLTMDVNASGPRDVFGQALKTMTDRLSSTMGDIQLSAQQVQTGSREVSDSSTSLSQGATEQAASLQEITASMTELASVVSTNAANAGQADQLSTSAKEAAETGVGQMKDMSTAMTDISKSSEEIAKIIKVIDDIAFQTNLLALNAAVEAARAGKHGKGFAVVAEEVRNLAGRSAKAARETSDLIEGSLEKVERGTDIAEITARSLAEIVEGVTKTSDLVGDIAIASNQQSQGIAEVSEGLKQIDSVTQQNTANSEETASAGQELAAQAGQLQELVLRFRLKDSAGFQAPVAPVRRAPAPAPVQYQAETPDITFSSPMEESQDGVIELVGSGWPE